MEDYKPANRYSLILQTVNNDKYYYDVSLDAFVKMYKESDLKKSSLQALDFLTSVKTDRNELAKEYGINDQIARCYITYQHKGENQLSPVFNNAFWSYVTYTYNGKELDLNDEKILEQAKNIYFEIANPDSEFSKMVVDNKNRMIKINQKTRTCIEELVAHERAIRNNDRVGNTSFNSCSIYSNDRYGFYQDFIKNLRSYREFRSLYFNYCHFMGNQEKIVKTEEKPKMKKKVVPPEQLSMFSEGLI
jgi:hypothetical protein